MLMNLLGEDLHELKRHFRGDYTSEIQTSINSNESNESCESNESNSSDNIEQKCYGMPIDVVKKITKQLLTAVYILHKKKIIHIEAGLRTYDKYSPFPEELNRKMISQIADIHICPTIIAVENLKREKLSKTILSKEILEYPDIPIIL